MKVGGKHYRTIYPVDDGQVVEVIDQTRLPHEFTLVRLHTLDDAARAIVDMIVRGAPLIGAAGAYGMALALRTDASTAALEAARTRLIATRCSSSYAISTLPSAKVTRNAGIPQDYLRPQGTPASRR